jgi:hypothetical protein
MHTFPLDAQEEIMLRKDYEKAGRLLDDLIAGMAEAQLGHPDRADLAALLSTVVKLKKLVQPPPSMEEILLRIVAPTHTERAKIIGISRQGYYNLLGGQVRPNSMTVKRLVELTGMKAETIRSAV